MKNVFLLIFFCTIALSALAGPGKSETDKRPNVIIILSDDQGYGDLSCHGNPVLQTPALDKLYNESIRFSNFHASPQCTPSRGELMSGLDALNNKASSVGAGRGFMRQDIVTMPEVFKENGYKTGIFGKWHLGDIYPDRPMDRGFDKSIWFKGWGLLSETEFDNDYYRTRYLDSLNFVQSDKYCTDLWFDQAMKWMGEMSSKQKPFFTYISLNVTHGPFHSPKADAEFYQDKVDKSTANFFGMIRNMDQNVERLDKWLEEKNLKDNTIVIFMTDNGGTGGVSFYNAGMRGKKESNYEGGHRVPLFIRWPQEQFGKPRTVTYATQIQDLLPTFIDVFGFKLNHQQKFDGESLKPLLQENKLKDRMFVVQYGGNKQPEKYFSCVVWDNWRLVGKDELYDLKKDPGQKLNVADRFPKELKQMRTFYDKWWANVSPGLDTLSHLLIDADKENPVVLCANDWSEGYINTQWAVAQASGDPKGGPWQIFVKESGKYQLELSRWPFHLNRSLTIAGPKKAVGGTVLRPGKAVPIASGYVSVNNNVPISANNTTTNAKKITIDIDINAGKNTLQAWFKDKDGQDLCGAYFVRVKKLDN